MLVILYCGFDMNPLVRTLLRNYSAEDLVVVSGTVHDFMLFGLRIFYEADSVILTASKIGEIIPDEARYACWKILERMGVGVYPPVPEEIVAFSIFRLGLTSRGVDVVSSFMSLCDDLKLGFTVTPITEDIPEIHVKSNGHETRLLSFLLSKEERRIDEVKASWDFKPLKQPLHCLKSSESVLIAPSDPVSILPFIRNAEVCSALKECEGHVTLVLPPVTPKIEDVLSHLGVEASPLSLVGLFEEFIDRVIIDQSLSGARREVSSSMNVEVLLADLSPLTLERDVPRVILDSLPLQKKRTVGVKDVIKKITKVIGLENKDRGET